MVELDKSDSLRQEDREIHCDDTSYLRKYSMRFEVKRSPFQGLSYYYILDLGLKHG